MFPNMTTLTDANYVRFKMDKFRSTDSISGLSEGTVAQNFVLTGEIDFYEFYGTLPEWPPTAQFCFERRITSYMRKPE